MEARTTQMPSRTFVNARVSKRAENSLKSSTKWGCTMEE